MHYDSAIYIEWDERLNLQENKERRKKIKEKLLMANKGKFLVYYKKIWDQDNTYNYIPTDIICILKDEDILDKVKEKLSQSSKQLVLILKSLQLMGESPITSSHSKLVQMLKVRLLRFQSNFILETKRLLFRELLIVRFFL